MKKYKGIITRKYNSWYWNGMQSSQTERVIYSNSIDYIYDEYLAMCYHKYYDHADKCWKEAELEFNRCSELEIIDRETGSRIDYFTYDY